MKTTTRTVIYNVELSPTEAFWLKGLLQNPIRANSPEEESELDSVPRASIFDRLPSFDEINEDCLS